VESEEGRMSYDIRLNGVEFSEPHDLRGGTYQVGGTTSAHLNVTYNYVHHFRRVLGEKGIRFIYGMTANDSIGVLEKAIAQMNGEPDDDYWAATEGNARAALKDLLILALRARDEGYGDATWSGD
jgi:hypothetical protein